MTPIFHPENWGPYRSSRPLTDWRRDGALIEDLYVEALSGCRRGAEEMYDRRLQIMLVKLH
jgi:hypothetical protein